MGKEETRARNQMASGACNEAWAPGRTGWAENWLPENEGQYQEKKGHNSGY